MLRNLFCFVLLIILSSCQLNATHIAGGHITYEFQNFNSDSTQATYSIKVTMFRDVSSSGATFDNDAAFGLYSKTETSSWEHDKTIYQNPGVVDKVLISDPSCLHGLDYEKASYEWIVTLDIDGSDYLIAYQRCCRTPSLTNIINPSETGIALQVEITEESVLTGNSSPALSQDPSFLTCISSPIDWNTGLSDQENDELVYSFCTPLNGGGPMGNNSGCCDCIRPDPDICLPDFENILYGQGYSKEEPFLCEPKIEIDSNTGEVSGTPIEIGLYQYGICVEEYRSGVLMSRLYFDNQTVVQDCGSGEIDSSLVPFIYLDSDGDQYGSFDISMRSCIVLAGYANNADDCDDNNFRINPGAVEIPDNDIDENCDGIITHGVNLDSLELNLFPNPSLSHIFIGVELIGIKILIYDMQGKIIIEDFYSSEGIDVNALSTGVYYLQVIEDGGNRNWFDRFLKV